MIIIFLTHREVQVVLDNVDIVNGRWKATYLATYYYDHSLIPPKDHAQTQK